MELGNAGRNDSVWLWITTNEVFHTMEMNVFPSLQILESKPCRGPLWSNSGLEGQNNENEHQGAWRPSPLFDPVYTEVDLAALSRSHDRRNKRKEDLKAWKISYPHCAVCSWSSAFVLQPFMSSVAVLIKQWDRNGNQMFNSPFRNYKPGRKQGMHNFLAISTWSLPSHNMWRGSTNTQGLHPASIWQRAQRKHSEWWMEGWQIPFHSLLSICFAAGNYCCSIANSSQSVATSCSLIDRTHALSGWKTGYIAAFPHGSARIEIWLW